jgi:F-box and leucine-rich repeat protein GRR1
MSFYDIDGAHLVTQVKLRNLDTLTDDAIIALALACPLLLEVDLYACSSITDRTLWALFRNCSHLRELSLNNCTQVTGEGFPQRDGKLLYIKGSGDPALIGLKPANHKFNHIPSKVLEIYNNSTDPNLQNVTALASRMFDHVRYLDLTGMTNLTDMAMAGIVATMPHIRNLVLAKCSSLTDESVQSICKLGKHIHFLHLGHVSK